MRVFRKWGLLVGAILFVIFSACSDRPQATIPVEQAGSATQSPDTSDPTVTPSAAIIPARVLRICLSSEPESLFLYGDASIAARNVRQAIYDGPVDTINYEVSPVILQRYPSLQTGDAYLETVQVEQGDQIVDAGGSLVTFNEGVLYRPSGCQDASCALAYTGEEPVSIDRLVVRFEMLPDLLWSDGERLTADDSYYSFEIARALYPGVRPDLFSRTETYRALDETTLEWRGVPGFMDPTYRTNFFSPLPRHAWGDLELDELLSADISNRTPIGWGPYVIEDWVAGDFISLSRNPQYFRAGEGLPYFDELVFRFVNDAQQALEDLQAGECDYADESLSETLSETELIVLEEQGLVSLAAGDSASWEHIDFGIESLDGALMPLFRPTQVRQAIALCINRERIVRELFPEGGQVLDSYLPPTHPYYFPNVERYDYDPQRGTDLLQSVGWVDHDSDPSTPRLSMSVADIPDGTALAFTYLISDGIENQSSAQIVQESLAECGVRVDLDPQPALILFTPGPEGAVFGRRFSMAQYAWGSSIVPPCFLYTSDEVPGPYPQHPKGWGGANATGFSQADFDLACLASLSSLPDWEAHRTANNLAQALYSEQVPSIPLYLYGTRVITRPDMCGVRLDPSSESQLWNLEEFNYGENCPSSDSDEPSP